MKINKLILSAFTALLLFASCDKEKDKEGLDNHHFDNVHDGSMDNSLIQENNLVMRFYADDYYNVITGDNLNEKLKWSRSSSDRSDDMESIGDFSIDFSNLEPVKVVDIKGQEVFFSNQRGHEFSVSISQDDVDLKMAVHTESSTDAFIDYQFDGSYSVNLLESIETGDVINFSERIPWVVFWGGAVLVASVVDYYCDSQVASGVENCTSQSMCSEVTTCGANCVSC